MTSYTSGSGSVGGISTSELGVIELRVISNLLQRDQAAQEQDQLSVLRNDQAFELGVVPPVVPGN
jgi:hypothetical protein